jgi:hypothetical protein
MSFLEKTVFESTVYEPKKIGNTQAPHPKREPVLVIKNDLVYN